MFLLRRHHVIAALDEPFPGDHPGQIGSVEVSLDPVDFVAAFVEVVCKSETFTDLGEDPIVSFRFSKRLDRWRLEDDDPVIELLLPVMAIAAETGPFGDVDALEIGASR